MVILPALLLSPDVKTKRPAVKHFPSSLGALTRWQRKPKANVPAPASTGTGDLLHLLVLGTLHFLALFVTLVLHLCPEMALLSFFSQGDLDFVSLSVFLC